MNTFPVLKDIYHQLKERGLCRSYRRFNIEWVGRSAGYLGAMQFYHCRISDEVLDFLDGRLVHANQFDLSLTLNEARNA